MIDDVFSPVDANIIKSIPLCTSWPQDTVMWHYSTDGNFFVKSTYHMIQRPRIANVPTCSDGGNKSFMQTHEVRMSPQKLDCLHGELRINILPTEFAFSKRIPDVFSICGICGLGEETIWHSLFECRLVHALWRAGGFAEASWAPELTSVLEIFTVAKTADERRWGKFIVVAWACCHAWNNWPFNMFDHNP